jgi:hypothetical protein
MMTAEQDKATQRSEQAEFAEIAAVEARLQQEKKTTQRRKLSLRATLFYRKKFSKKRRSILPKQPLKANLMFPSMPGATIVGLMILLPICLKNSGLRQSK